MLIVVLLAAILLGTLGKWRVFQKMGFNGWKTLIPFYSDYLMFKGVYGNGKRVLVVWLAPVGAMFLNMIGAFSDSSAIAAFFSLIALGLNIWCIVVQLRLNFDLAHAFGQSTAFGWGLMLVNYVFMILLGFSDYKCHGKESINESDVISATAYKLEGWLRSARSGGKNAVTQLKELCELHDKGVIDDAVFEAKKAEMIKRI